jgi:hypothetical protein
MGGAQVTVVDVRGVLGAWRLLRNEAPTNLTVSQIEWG